MLIIQSLDTYDTVWAWEVKLCIRSPEAWTHLFHAGDAGKDAITIAEGNNMNFDHVSVSWGRDETFSINGDVTNVTISDCIVAQGLETHSAGGLIQTSGGVSIFRTLYIDNQTRNPKVKGVNDFTNNVVYNWGSGGGYIAGDSDGPSEANIMNNVFIRLDFLLSYHPVVC